MSQLRLASGVRQSFVREYEGVKYADALRIMHAGIARDSNVSVHVVSFSMIMLVYMLFF